MKDFRKYSLEQLKQLLDRYRNMRMMSRELLSEIKSDPSGLIAHLTPPYYWSTIYTLTYTEHLACFICVAGLSNDVHQAALSEDPQASGLELFDAQTVSPWDHGSNGEYDVKHLFGLLYSLEKSMESMVAHGKFLNELVVDAQNGDDRALFKAVGIDRSIVNCPPIADRIALAEITCDEVFFKKLSNAFKDGPRELDGEYDELRYLLFALEEAEALETLSTERAYEVFCEELAVYPADGSDAARSLNQFISRWRKRRAT